MRKISILIGIIIVAGLVYFIITKDSNVTPPPSSDKKPVITSVTPSITSACCVNIEGSGFLTDEATNEVIWKHKEKGFKIWGGGMLSKDGDDLIHVNIPVDNGDYYIKVRNKNGISNSVSYTVDWTGTHGVPPIYIVNVNPLEQLPGDKIEIETNIGFVTDKGNKIIINALPLSIERIETFIFEDTLDSRKSSKIITINGFIIESRSELSNPPYEFEISKLDITNKKAIFRLPENLSKNSEYLVRIEAKNISYSPYILYKTGK